MIELQNVTKDFKVYTKYPGLSGAIKGLFSRKFTVKRAVNDISFTIPDGEIVGYIGANGAGKSTTIKIMSGILVPTSGKCAVNGIVPYEQRKLNAKNIGVVFGQRTQLWWDLPLSETYTVLKEIYEITDDDFTERMKFFKEMLSLDEFLSSTVRTLSLGQRMRADIAASLLHSPKVLFLDEPTIGLDVVVKDKIREGIRQMNKRFGTTVILTTHDLEDIQELCSRIIIIDNGSKIYDGSLSSIKASYGYMKVLETEVLPAELEERFKDKTTVWETKDGLTSISFDSRVISASGLISSLLEVTELKDIAIKETRLSDIIKKIYNKGV